MKEQAGRGSDCRGVLNNDLKKHSMGWRTELTKVEKVSPEIKSSFALLVRGNEFYRVVLFERDYPGSVDVIPIPN